LNVVSLLPSATDIVCSLGLGDQLVGVSHSCVLPPGMNPLPVVTSTTVPVTASSKMIDDHVRNHLQSNNALYDLDIETLNALAPDVIVSQALCDVCAVSTGDVKTAVKSLPGSPTVIDLQPNVLADVLIDCQHVIEALGNKKQAREKLVTLNSRLADVVRLTESIPRSARPRVAFLEWLEPPFNGGHWNPEIVANAGGIDVLGNPGQPSATIDWTSVQAANADVIVVACCGFPVKRALEDIEHVTQTETWQALPAVANGNVFVADGRRFFSSPGPALIDALEMLAHALHPGIHPQKQPEQFHRLSA